MSLVLIALVLYLIFLLGFAIYSAFAVYHLWQFGYAGDLCRPVGLIYLVLAGVIVFSTLIFVLNSVI